MNDIEVVRNLQESLRESYARDRCLFIRNMNDQVQDMQDIIDAMVRCDEFLPCFLPESDLDNLLLRLQHTEDVLDAIRRMKDSTWDGDEVL